MEGAISIGRYLSRSIDLLPYAGPGSVVRHVVGSGQGGGYEWTGRIGTPPGRRGGTLRGLTAVELDQHAKITRLTAVWDGAYATDAQLGELMRLSIQS